MNAILSRVILYCQDPERLKQFYLNNFGLSLAEEIKDVWVVLQAGQVEIAFHKIGEAYRSEGEFRAESNSKLVFEIQEDLFEARARLLENDAVMREVKSYEGFPYLLCDGEDPEGNVFQLMKRA